MKPSRKQLYFQVINQTLTYQKENSSVYFFKFLNKAEISIKFDIFEMSCAYFVTNAEVAICFSYKRIQSIMSIIDLNDPEKKQ